MTDYPFNLDGPHSPDETRRVADLAAECIRYLNRATLPGQDGLESPADVCDLVGSLMTAAERLPQLLRQAAGFLRDQAATGHIADTRRAEGALSARVCANDLKALADIYLIRLGQQLALCHSDLSTLYVKDRPET